MGRPSTRILKTQRLSKMMTPSPHLSTSSLRPLHPATSHNNNNVYCLFVNSAQALCACHIPGHLEAYCVLSRFQWIHVDANILETMPRKKEKKKNCFGTCGQDLRKRRKKVHRQECASAPRASSQRDSSDCICCQCGEYRHFSNKCNAA